MPRGRVIRDGAGLATNVSAVGNDSRLKDTLIAVHEYTMLVGNPHTSESAPGPTTWPGSSGGMRARTVATEWAPR